MTDPLVELQHHFERQLGIDRELNWVRGEAWDEGYRKAIADLRDGARQLLDRSIPPPTGVPYLGRAADFLESRLSAGPDMAQVVARERDADEATP